MSVRIHKMCVFLIIYTLTFVYIASTFGMNTHSHFQFALQAYGFPQDHHEEKETILIHC